jgi:indoleamine 2,3-dioxygenase
VATTLDPISEYDLSEKFGCLWGRGSLDVPLPSELQLARQAALQLPDLLATGQVRSYLREMLPGASTSLALQSCTDIEARTLIDHYLFLAQAYVWGEKEKVSILPRFLAVPIAKLASRLGQPPILTYQNYVLDNWKPLRENDEITLENVKIPLLFFGGQDEYWFIAVHVAVEAAAAPALCLVRPLVAASAANELDEVQSGLEHLCHALQLMNETFSRMTERCDPYIYYKRVRPFINGWKDNPSLPGGLVYEGVEEFGGKPQQFRGETGAQSAVVPIFDALLGILHADNDDLRSYLDDLHRYRPTGHRLFIEQVSEMSKLREVVVDASEARLTDAYNECVSQIAGFRKLHLDFAQRYVFEQIDRENFGGPKIGTGGTPFVRYLGKHLHETVESILK